MTPDNLHNLLLDRLSRLVLSIFQKRVKCISNILHLHHISQTFQLINRIIENEIDKNFYFTFCASILHKTMIYRRKEENTYVLIEFTCPNNFWMSCLSETVWYNPLPHLFQIINQSLTTLILSIDKSLWR